MKRSSATITAITFLLTLGSACSETDPQESGAALPASSGSSPGSGSAGSNTAAPTGTLGVPTTGATSSDGDVASPGTASGAPSAQGAPGAGGSMAGGDPSTDPTSTDDPGADDPGASDPGADDSAFDDASAGGAVDQPGADDADDSQAVDDANAADDSQAPADDVSATDDAQTDDGAASDPLPMGGGDGFYRMEALDRGVIAVAGVGGVYVGWRMLGYEYQPQSDVSYELYRDGELIATVTDSTNYLDAGGSASSRYAVAAVIGGATGERSPEAPVWTQNYVSVPLDSPGSGYSSNDASAGDLDGDGQYELVLKWDPNNAKDNSQDGVTGDVFLDGLELDGTLLWRINLGPNIRAGAHYTQFIVMDFDGDGRSELAVKTAPGTRDGTGEFLGLGPAAADDDAAVYRNGSGYVLTGPEYLSVFDGESGAELATATFDQARGNVGAWGDDYGNRVDRFLAAGAYLDATGLPSFVMARGYYTRSTLTAWNFRDGELSQLWKFDSDQTPRDDSGRDFTGQGAHSLSVADVDDDPEQEIIYGAMTIDHDGRGMCSTGLNHGDALHVTDLLPDRPGMEVFMPHEYEARPLWSVRDGATCEIVRQGAVSDADVGRGVASDIFAGNPGGELWASSGVPLTSASTGQTVGNGNPASINFLIWWDADESRELEDGTSISDYGGGSLLSCGSCSSNNGTKSTPTLVADLFGDWREEIIWRESNDSALRVYTTTDVTSRRIYTLMHDAQYRAAIAWQNVGYNQPPHPSFHIGDGMAAPPVPNITVE